MRTLFSPNILSPSPESAPQIPTAPYELSFSSTAFSSSNTSSKSSPGSNDWLTRHIQNQTRLTHDPLDGHFAPDAAQRSATLAHRKVNPTILFMGMRRSGKSSIQKVIFEKMSPAETLYLDPTHRIQSATMESILPIESLDIPATLLLPPSPAGAPSSSPPSSELDPLLASAGALIWVLDMQDEYYASVAAFARAAVAARARNPRLRLDVFIHKADGLSEEYKADTFRDVRQRVQDELTDAVAEMPPVNRAGAGKGGEEERGKAAGGMGGGGGGGAGMEANVSFYATSVFDHSVFEAMSKVVQRLVPQLPAMEALLNRLCSTCRIQKAYLFDAASKIYLATDASPTFLRDYEVCSDYVDVVVDVKQIYGWGAGEDGSSEGGDDDDDDDGAGAEVPGESVIMFERSGETYIYAREMNEYLTLICVMGHGSTPDKRMLIDYNVAVLKDALAKMFRV